jgi:hypothetical protein
VDCFSKRGLWVAETFKYLSDCKPLELVRVKINAQALFAIVGAKGGQSYQPLVVLSATDAPWVINLLPQGRIDGDFDAFQVLAYGDYAIEPDHSQKCEVGEGGLFTAAGSVVVTEDDRWLTVRMESHIGYLSLTTGALRSEPGGGRAAFAKWYVQRPCKPDPLLTFGYVGDAEPSTA